MRRITKLLAAAMAMLMTVASCGNKGDDSNEDVSPEMQIISTIPENGATVSEGDLSIAIVFNQTISANITNAVQPTINGKTEINGRKITYTKSAPATLSISPSISVKMGNTYELVIPSGAVKDYNKEIKINFQGPQDHDAPTLTSTSPTHGKTDVYPGRKIKITYSEDVKIEGQVQVNGQPVQATVQANTITLDLITEPSTEYTVSIPDGAITDMAGNKAAPIKLIFTTSNGEQMPLSNGNATAQKLFNYMNSIYGQQIISGAIANVSFDQAEARLVKTLTGKTPAMLTIDYIFSNLTKERSAWEQASLYRDITVYKAHSDQNGIISACWHLNVPSAEKYAAWNKVNGPEAETWNAKHYFSAKEAVKPGTWQNEFLDFSLEQVIIDLKLFNDADIPVVWRPFHEASGNACISGNDRDAWFWWGMDGAEAYKELWKYMFNKFKDAGLNNLIWVWTTQVGINKGNNWYCKDDSNWYPGDDFVDIVAHDMYEMPNTKLSVAEHDAIKELFPNKMITLGENGSIPNISDIWNAGGKFLYFMPWYTYDLKDLDQSLHANKAWWQDAAKCESVLFLEDLPNWRE